MHDDMSIFLSGGQLYGDDFSQAQIDAWFADEAEGYADLGAKDRENYRYPYHQLNNQHGFRFLKDRNFRHTLGVGSAYGHELEPVLGKVDRVTILDPSDAFAGTEGIQGTPCTYVKPCSTGNMPFDNGKFDLITCFGVLHHIPNVSHVISECSRCLADDGVMLLREPIVSMGDWRKKRKGLTKHERGIPIGLLEDFVIKAGMSISNKAFCTFPPLTKMANRFGARLYSSTLLTSIDSVLSHSFAWNAKYHRTRFFEKFAPASAYLVLTKQT